MGALIYAYSGGKCVGKCDANCYEATHPECNCICGGMNHGKGKAAAVANTEKYAERMIEEYRKRDEFREARVDFVSPLTDNSLFR